MLDSFNWTSLRWDPKTSNNVTGKPFKTEVLGSAVPVLVDFYADWCGACWALNPTLVELAGEANGRCKIVKIDADTERES
jgi:thioredoxin 1